jgi:hypothetical protein
MDTLLILLSLGPGYLILGARISQETRKKILTGEKLVAADKTAKTTLGAEDSSGAYGTTMSEIDRIIADVTPRKEAEDATAAKVQKQNNVTSKDLLRR